MDKEGTLHHTSRVLVEEKQRPEGFISNLGRQASTHPECARMAVGRTPASMLCRCAWSAADLEILESGHVKGRNGASRTVEVLLEQLPRWLRSVISRKANSMGLSNTQNGGSRRWTEETDRMLISCEGFEMERIERRMKRSLASIRSRLAALDRNAELFGGFRTKDLMEMLHLGNPSPGAKASTSAGTRPHHRRFAQVALQGAP